MINPCILRRQSINWQKEGVWSSRRSYSPYLHNNLNRRNTLMLDLKCKGFIVPFWMEGWSGIRGKMLREQSLIYPNHFMWWKTIGNGFVLNLLMIGRSLVNVVWKCESWTMRLLIFQMVRSLTRLVIVLSLVCWLILLIFWTLPMIHICSDHSHSYAHMFQ